MLNEQNIESLPSFYKRYAVLVKDYPLLTALKDSGKKTEELLSTLPETIGSFRYELGKWSVQEVLCHIIDAERIFAYRALRFARNDKTPLPPFEENDYVPESNADARTISQLKGELIRLRTTTIDLFSGFTSEMMSRTGLANNMSLSVLQLGYIIAGHETHHRIILQERYLNQASR